MASFRRSRALILSLVCCFGGMALAGSAPYAVPAGERKVAVSDAGEGAARRITVENGFLRAVINPDQGGRIESLIYKKTGQEMTLPRTESRPGGMLSDQVWEQDYWHGDWNGAKYEAVVLPPQSGKAQVRLSAKGTLLAGVTILKTVTVSADRCAVQVEYEMTCEKTVEKMSARASQVRLDFWFHNAIAGTGRAFLPSPAGVLARPVATEAETWVFEPTQGWNAFITDQGAGLAATMESRWLRAVRSEFSPVSTVEWVWRYMDAVPGMKVKSPAQLGLFSGLKEVTGAGDDAVIEMAVGPKAGAAVPVRVCVAALADVQATLSLSLARIEGTERVPVKSAALEGGVAVNLKAGATGAFEIPVPIGNDGSYVIQGALKGADRVLATFEKELVVGKASGTYAMALDGPREVESGRRNYVPLNFNFNSLGYETPHVTWAKPYAGGRPRVLALMLPRFEREAVELAQRFDMDLTCAYLDPRDPDHTEFIDQLGDGTRTLTLADINANLSKALLREYDVIILGGDVIKKIPAACQTRILTMVDNGAGLIAIGVPPKPKPPAPPAKAPALPATAGTKAPTPAAAGSATAATKTPSAAGKAAAPAAKAPAPAAKPPVPPAFDEITPFLPLEPAAVPAAFGRWSATAGLAGEVAAALPFAALPPVLGGAGALKKTSVPGAAGPQALIMSDKNVAAAIVPHGKGRIVQLSSYGTLALRSVRDVANYPFDVHEYQYAILGRLLYLAAGKPSPVNLLAIDCAREQVSVRLTATKAAAVKIHLRLRDRIGWVLDERDVTAALKEGAAEPISIPVPAAAASACFLADVIVSDASGTLAWGAGAFPEPKAKIEKWASDKTDYLPGEKMTLTATIKGELPAGAKLRAEVWDPDGRKTGSIEALATAAETKVTLPVERLIKSIFEVRGMIVTDSGIVSQSVCEAWVRQPRRRDLLTTFFWGYPPAGPGSTNDLIAKYFKLFHEIGMNGNWGDNQPAARGWAFARAGMLYVVPGSGMSWRGFSKALVASDPTLNTKGADTIGDPGINEKIRQRGELVGKQWAMRHVMGYSCADENRDPQADSCYCPLCLGTFRKWLKETQYKTLDDLNKEWGTAFKTWDEVMPMTKDANPKTGDVDEITPHFEKTRSYAAWADQRQFNKVMYSSHVRAFVQGVLSADTDALVGDSGTQESAAQGGRDYSQLAPAYTMEAAYPGTQNPEQDGMAPDLIRWMWTGYNKPSPRAKNVFWYLIGSKIYGFGIFVSGTYIDPDWTLPADGRDTQLSLREMNRGFGQMLVSASRAWDPVYVLQSTASLHGSYAAGQKTLHSEAIRGCMQMMNDLAVGYRAMSYTMVAQGNLQKSGARVLFLPHMVALSEAECRNIREWVEQGGTVVADLQPGIMDEHCRMYDHGRLDDLFGVDRSQASLKELPAAPDPKDPKKMVKTMWQLQAASGATSGVPAWPCNLVEVGVRGTTAQPLWTAQGSGGEAAPVVFHRQAGKGHAYYMACNIFKQCAPGTLRDLSVRDRTLHEPDQNLSMIAFQQLFVKALADEGIPMHTVVYLRDAATGKAGARSPFVNIFNKDAGANRYALIMRDFYIYDPVPTDVPVRATFDRKAHIYDSLAGKYLGYGDSVDLAFNNYTLRLYSLLPYQVDRMELKAASDAVAAGTDAVIAARLVVAPSGAREDALTGTLQTHWFRVDVMRPDGRAVETYSSNIEAKGGQVEVRVPFALNDPVGKWKVRVQDVATGVAAEAAITLR